MEFVYVFIIGGLLCVIAQLLMDFTKLVSGQILVIYIVAGVILTALGLYEPLVKLGECGATIPLTGFGYSLVKGTIYAVKESGIIGVFTGPLTATSGGITGAIIFGYLFSIISSPHTKK